jgi:tRNA nucleotidyltransferase (CCA-adding enzyme)
LLDLTQLLQGLDLQNTVSTERSVLSPRRWPCSLEWLPKSTCLVGGSVRDALLGRTSDYLDLDFVLPDGVVETAKRIARHYQAGFVLLDADRQIARVVFAQGTVDFAQQVGASLEEDLHRRDFTVNAIAYNPHCDRFVDPLHGCLDLEQRRLRMVSAENLEEDPLRLLRAYRQAAQLGFSLEPDTQATIRRLAPLLRRIAAERIQSELNYLLSSQQGIPWLQQAWEDGLLAHWLPDANAQSMEQIRRVDRAVVLLKETHPTFAQTLFQRISATPAETKTAATSASALEPTTDIKASGSARHWLMTAKLACLLNPNPELAEARLRQLKYSRNEIQAVGTVLRWLHQLNSDSLSQANQGCPVTTSLQLNLRQQYGLFQGVGTAFPALAVLAMAHGVPLEAIAPLIERFITPGDPVAHPTPLLTGQDLMRHLNLPPGPQIGRLLAALQLAKAEGTISTLEEAIAFAAEMREC